MAATMRVFLVALLVTLAFLLLVVARAAAAESAWRSAQHRREVQSLLKRINKHPVASIQSPDGDIIDCVHISMRYKTYISHTSTYTNHPLELLIIIDFKFCSVNIFFSPNEQYGVAYATGDNEYYGTKMTVNVWQPTPPSGDFSLAQLWIAAGSYDNKDLNTIEAGWQVYPAMYGDGSTRLFIYWTSDAYNSTGCYNLVCSGFVQTDTQFTIGGSLSPVSTYGGTQYELDILVWKDPNTHNWWLQVGGINLGYWPLSIFTRLTTSASLVEWGGEVTSLATPMGSGHFPEEGFGKASYIRTLQVVDSSNYLKSPNGVGLIASNPNFYNVISGVSNDSWGTYIYFGGPGMTNSRIDVI
ncbi:unnamed protein product [Urochloa humidicola]